MNRYADLAREIFWSRSVAGKMGRILGALSVISLIRFALHYGMSATFHEVLTYYGGALKLSLGWLDPSIRQLLTNVLHGLRIDIHFSEMWRHVFLVMWILFFRDATVAFSDKRPVTACVRMVLGFVIAAVVSILASSSYGQVSDHVNNTLIAIFPIIGLFVYGILIYLYAAAFEIKYLNKRNGTPERSRAVFLKSAFGRAVHRFLLAVTVIAASFLIPCVWALPSPAGGLVALIFATIAVALYWLWRGARFASQAAGNGLSWIEAFRQSEAGRFGVAVTSVFAWIVVFIVLNTGLKELGL